MRRKVLHLASTEEGKEISLSEFALLKLIEECGELVQIASKKLMFPDTDMHPDSQGSMYARINGEVADVLACIEHMMPSLDRQYINQRVRTKLERFKRWDTQTPGE
jgi:NTP pyrophosphatase (non-canonical NTP hydrolase)